MWAIWWWRQAFSPGPSGMKHTALTSSRHRRTDISERRGRRSWRRNNERRKFLEGRSGRYMRIYERIYENIYETPGNDLGPLDCSWSTFSRPTRPAHEVQTTQEWRKGQEAVDGLWRNLTKKGKKDGPASGERHRFGLASCSDSKHLNLLLNSRELRGMRL